MEARYAVRKSQLLDECQVAPDIFEQVLPRLEAFKYLSKSNLIFRADMAQDGF